jgi:hypothetical protein
MVNAALRNLLLKNTYNLDGNTMKKYLVRLLLGLAIIAGYLTTVSTASAFTLRNYQTGLCLGIAAGNPNPGTALVTWTCDGTPSQQWGQITSVLSSNGWQERYVYSTSFPPANGSPFYLSSGLAILTTTINDTTSPIGTTSTSVIGVRAGFMANGTPLIEWQQTADTNQQWHALFVGNNFDNKACYSFENVAFFSFNGPINLGWYYVMGVSGGKTNIGTPVVIWQQFLDVNGIPDYHGHPDQLWCVY